MYAAAGADFVRPRYVPADVDTSTWKRKGPVAFQPGYTLTAPKSEQFFLDTGCVAKLKQFKPGRPRELKVWGPESLLEYAWKCAERVIYDEIGENGGRKDPAEQAALRKWQQEEAQLKWEQDAQDAYEWELAQQAEADLKELELMKWQKARELAAIEQLEQEARNRKQRKIESRKWLNGCHNRPEHDQWEIPEEQQANDEPLGWPAHATDLYWPGWGPDLSWPAGSLNADAVLGHLLTNRAPSKHELQNAASSSNAMPTTSASSGNSLPEDSNTSVPWRAPACKIAELRKLLAEVEADEPEQDVRLGEPMHVNLPEPLLEPVPLRPKKVLPAPLKPKEVLPAPLKPLLEPVKTMPEKVSPLHVTPIEIPKLASIVIPGLLEPILEQDPRHPILCILLE